MNTSIVEPEKRTISYRLPVDLIAQIETEALAEGQKRTSGRVFNPSATVERILREYFARKPKGRSTKK